jgi:hypothetical protein
VRLGIKQVLSLGALVLGMVGVGCDDQPTLYHYVGEVTDVARTTSDFNCTDVTLKKQDGSITVFRVRSWPPTWKGMYGDILLKEDPFCGYIMVSAKEEE